jgi:hypothetical protein
MPLNQMVLKNSFNFWLVNILTCGNQYEKA